MDVPLIPRLHDTAGCQTGLYNRFDNRLYRVNGASDMLSIIAVGLWASIL